MMQESAALLLECPFNRPGLCIGSSCMGWVADTAAVVHWQVMEGSTDMDLLPDPPFKQGQIASVRQPGDNTTRDWTFLHTHSNGTIYHDWCYTPDNGSEGYCGRIEG